ncbi:hypothetical protein D3C76_1813600 [compost metagenome]
MDAVVQLHFDVVVTVVVTDDLVRDQTNSQAVRYCQPTVFQQAVDTEVATVPYLNNQGHFKWLYFQDSLQTK